MVAAVLLVAAYGVTSHFAAGDRIAKGVVVSGIELGRMPRDQAEHTVQSWAAKQAHRDITLTAMDRRWNGPLASLGLSVGLARRRRSRFRGRPHGGLFDSRDLRARLRSGRGKHITARLRVDRLVLQRTLRKVADAVNRPHKDARIQVVDSRLEITQDSCGIKLDEDQAASVIAAGARSGQNVIQLPIVTDPPEVTARDCAAINTLLSSYTTSFNRGLRGRTHNLMLAARVALTARFSSRARSSPSTMPSGRGWRREGIRSRRSIVKGKLEDGIGGGVCQVSSTLFNAVLLAGLNIKERSPHSQTVPYVTAGPRRDGRLRASRLQV